MISTKQKCGGLYRDMSSDSEHLNGFELHYFPAATWAVFVAKGSSRADAKQKTFDQITKEWFPQTNYRLDNTYSVMISYQTPVNQDNDADLGIFWVPIVEA
jgi:predicted transcriptional regulator YdeE